MGASETAKEVMRIASTAGISKDVIDLMEKKLTLLAGEVVDLTAKNAVLATKISKLEIENGQLRAQMKHPKQGSMQESMGLLWKRTADGFESVPYCLQCPDHPIMVPMRAARNWVCSAGHIAPRSSKPPSF
jgi:hypothetical protein